MDMSQETLVRAYEKLERFDPARSFFPWLYAIGVNIARDYLRRAGREANLFDHNFDENDTIDETSNPASIIRALPLNGRCFSKSHPRRGKRESPQSESPRLPKMF